MISDTHLGTYGCHAKELLVYLRSVDPSILILNGDIIDIWNFSKSWFPKSHMQVIRQILKMAERGCRVYYITGNHDEALRKYEGTTLGNLHLEDKLILSLDGSIVWFFHGDIFDATTKGWAKILAKSGGKGYDLLILINRLINRVLEGIGREKMSFSKKVKSSVKKAVQWINNFEMTAAELAADQDFDVVVCGHIHQPEKRMIETSKGKILYMNSGDWVENCTSLEYSGGNWQIHTFNDKIEKHETDTEDDVAATPKVNKDLLENFIFSDTNQIII